MIMKLTERQQTIIKIVKDNQPITGDRIAKQLGLTKPTLRSDLSVLTMTGMLDAKPKVGYYLADSPVDPLLFEEVYQKKIAEVMTPAVCISQSTTVGDAITSLFMYDVGTLYVTENDELVGVISRKDLLRTMVSSGDQTLPVAIAMTRVPKVVAVTADQTILETADLLMRSQVDSLPVVAADNNYKVIGKITKTIVVKHFVDEGHRSKGLR